MVIVQLLWITILHRVKVITFGCSGVCFMLVAVFILGKVTGSSGYRKINGRYREAHLSKVLSRACAHPPFDSLRGPPHNQSPCKTFCTSIS